ncbi:WcaG Nucleoside-diphosphate-sugar epimerases [uncultured Caudovirales phage]|uniref:WcaG Nucleoside-diphosphate-sugar epimerases n=1 Tax=uncultured Caudovirales phage TaxID=2100421 RepID=A0A6J5LL77_9CAUD|nr:WcaG Nucleoside-diphosphate-sugar epimerases [uncultured Caudovirales phage]
MKILITGAAGFIGHNVVRFLEKKGHECFGIDNRTNYGFIPKDEQEYLLKERGKRLHAIPHVIDIRDTDKIKAFVGTFSIKTIVHLASFPRQKVVQQDPVTASQTMVTGLINLLEAAVTFKIKRFVYISSSMVYGDFDSDVTEDAPCNPIGQYGIMKYMGEKLVEDYARKYGFEYVIIRPSAVYGEYDVEDRVVSKFMLAAMRGDTLKVKGAGEVLDFTYVEDAAMGITQATLSKNSANKIYNITRSSEQQYTLKDAAELAIQIAGKGSLEIQDRDLSFPKRGRLNITRAINDFGYDPKVNVEEGFRRYYEWFQKSYYWQKKLGE